MSYLLDTDIFSLIAKRRSPLALRRLQEIDVGSVAVSVISLGEIRFGLRLNPVPAHIAQRIGAMLRIVQARPLGPDVTEHYADTRAYLQRKGTPIGTNDLWLAAHALAEDLTLVTNNEREFKRVPKLRIENWLR